jgi:hypothetical protein
LFFGLAGALLAACATPSEPFYHRLYRENYAITPQELTRLQFYISTEVLAHAEGAAAETTPAQVTIVPAGTPGLVREVGPDWLRVAFTEGGEGVLFLTRAERTDSVYMLATRSPGGEIVRLSELPKPVLTQAGRSYELVYGADAYLLVNARELNQLIRDRPHAAGLER